MLLKFLLGAFPQGTKVAIKVLRHSGMREVDKKRFEREARYLHSLRHPRLVRILDLGEVDENPYLVMEHLDGETLEQRMLDERRLGLPDHERQQQQAELLAEICEGLHAHLAGIVHRDMKPGNVTIGDDNHVTILDFGMAKRVVAPDQLTMTGTVLGTPAYMSPEQAQKANVNVLALALMATLLVSLPMNGPVAAFPTTPITPWHNYVLLSIAHW